MRPAWARAFPQLHEALGPIRSSFDEERGKVVLEKQTIEKGIKALEKEIDQKNTEIKELKEAKEIEFERSEEVKKNRRKLQEMRIPFIPLYKVLDFSKTIEEKEKQAIEAALVDLGIIDALIIPNKFKKQILTDQQLGADKYLFAEANFMGYSLVEYLTVDQTELDGIRTRAERWLAHVIAQKKHGYLIIAKEYEKQPVELKIVLQTVMTAINTLENNPKTITRLAIFASTQTKNPHYLDGNKLGGRLLISGLAYLAEVKPLQLNLWNLAKIKEIICRDKKIFVFENPVVFSEGLERTANIKPTLLCTSGQLKLASIVLLDKLVKHTDKIYYFGDFDPEGIKIAHRLRKDTEKN